MAYSRGGIYLANFNPSKGTEAGKIRPCLVMQSDLLNHVGHPSTTVLPLTTNLIDDAAPLRFRLSARDSLMQASDVMLDQARTLDNRRLETTTITQLESHELILIEKYWRIVLGL